MDKSLSTAFTMVGKTVGQAGNVMGGVMDAITKASDKAFNKATTSNSQENPTVLESTINGALKQVKSATDQIRNAGVMTKSLNAAKSTI